MEHKPVLLPYQEFGIPGYSVAKTVHYLNKSAIISPKLQTSESLSEKKKASFPDPTKYSPSLQKMHETCWKRANGKFLISKKINIVEEQVKRCSSNPGPGAYFKENSKNKNLGSTLGRFDKCERLSFLTTVESYAEETPSCWKYASFDNKNKGGLRWVKPKIKEKGKKEDVGPGKYSEGIEKAMSRTLNSSPRYSFPKSKSDKRATRLLTPGVGTYKAAEAGFFNNMVKKTRAAVIFPYKVKGFTETVTKSAMLTPGPGAYNIGSPIKS